MFHTELSLSSDASNFAKGCKIELESCLKSFCWYGDAKSKAIAEPLQGYGETTEPLCELLIIH